MAQLEPYIAENDKISYGLGTSDVFYCLKTKNKVRLGFSFIFLPLKMLKEVLLLFHSIEYSQIKCGWGFILFKMQ